MRYTGGVTTKTAISLRINSELLVQVDALARARNTSRTEVIEWALERALPLAKEFVARGDGRTVSGRIPIASEHKMQSAPDPLPTMPDPVKRTALSQTWRR
jgi:metal-responsive CopG/Arc/MetJ family transcriptional regulator